MNILFYSNNCDTCKSLIRILENEKLIPIFIIGLPRSGSKLIRELLNNHTIKLSDGTKVTADNIILATGGRPKNIPISAVRSQNTKREVLFSRPDILPPGSKAQREIERAEHITYLPIVTAPAITLPVIR